MPIPKNMFYFIKVVITRFNKIKFTFLIDSIKHIIFALYVQANNCIDASINEI